jgi:hypothetical protein
MRGYDMKIRILLSSALLLGLIGAACTDKGANSPVNPSATALAAEDEMALPRQRRPQPTRDELVIRNCLHVRDAAEAWAAESGGMYPTDPESRNAAGHTLVDLLPGGMHLVNPFDGTRDEPRYLCHGNPGETDYLYYDGYGCGECGLDDCGHDGYMITGFGESGEIFRFARNWPDDLAELDSRTIANCLVVRDAVERFAVENGGEYPSDLADENPLGHSVVDLLPCGILLPNSYLCVRIEPNNGRAVNPGEIGYVVTMEDDHCTGYWITGYGRRELVVTIGRNASDHEPPTNAKLRPHAL